MNTLQFLNEREWYALRQQLNAGNAEVIQHVIENTLLLRFCFLGQGLLPKAKNCADDSITLTGKVKKNTQIYTNFSRALGEFCFGVGMIAKASLYFEIHCRCVENVYGRESDIVYNSFNLVGCFLINAGLPGKARHYCLKALAFSITEKELW